MSFRVFSPSDDEIEVAVRSLLGDSLRPTVPHIAHRLCEIAAGRLAVRGGDLRVCRHELSSRLHASGIVHTEPGSNGGVVVTIPGVVTDFVEDLGSADPFSEETWSAARQYLAASAAEGSFPAASGRYLCARHLAERELDFLAGMSLGHVCHLLKLAEARKLVGYRAGLMVPWALSDACQKDRLDAGGRAHG